MEEFGFNSELSPETVLDAWAEDGWYSFFLEKRNTKIILTHKKDEFLNGLFQMAKEENLNVLPLWMRISKPSLPHGVWGRFPGAKERLKSDLVIMPNLIDLLYNEPRCKNYIASYLAEFSSKWAFIVVDLNHRVINDKRLSNSYQLIPWYEKNFYNDLNKYFKKIETKKNIPDDKTYVLCSK